jgi:hypothetical protein
MESEDIVANDVFANDVCSHFHGIMLYNIGNHIPLLRNNAPLPNPAGNTRQTDRQAHMDGPIRCSLLVLEREELLK